MTYRVPLPDGGARSTLDIIDPFSSMVQRFMRREGLCSYEPETAATLLTLFELQDGPFALYDVGANVGLYSHLCKAMFDAADVHAFEPTPEIADICRSIAQANGFDLTVIEAAVSDRSGTAALHLSETSDASNSLAADFKKNRGTVEVERVTLDEYRTSSQVAPAVLKIDVETHEPAVLAGAAELLATDRPIVIVEVLRRRDFDQGAVIQAAFDGLGYSYYPLSMNSDWTPVDTIRGSGTIERDWLLTPDPLPEDFGQRWDVWQTRLASCTADRNSRPPLGGAVRAAIRRGGVGELIASTRRHLVDDVVPAVSRRILQKPLDRRKRLVRRTREFAPVVRVMETLVNRQYRIGRPGGLPDRLIARLVRYDAPDPSLRERSVDSLVELFFEIIEVTGVRRFVEAGAKDAGASVRAASDMGVDQVVAFEANPYTHRRFVNRVSDAGVDYRHLALSEASGEVTFLVRLTDDGEPMADGQGSMLVRPDHEPGYEHVMVSAVRLDEAVDVVEPQASTAVWVDVEGASSQVLRGATKVLQSVEVAIVEVESARRWDGQEWIDRDVIDFFLGIGLQPVARDRQSREQYNIVFARAGRIELDATIDRWRAAQR